MLYIPIPSALKALSFRSEKTKTISVTDFCSVIFLKFFVYCLCTFVFLLIIYMKKLLDSDWLRAVQFKCNTSAKSVTPVQKV